MPFSTHLQSLQNINKKLSALQNPTPLQGLVRDATGHILQHCALFNGCVSTDNPFLDEFFTCISCHSTAVDEDNCAGIFECLVSFFREKSLRLGRAQLAPVEEAVLNYFETSTRWDPYDNQLINHWYWHILPRRILGKALHGMGYYTSSIHGAV